MRACFGSIQRCICADREPLKPTLLISVLALKPFVRLQHLPFFAKQSLLKLRFGLLANRHFTSIANGVGSNLDVTLKLFQWARTFNFKKLSSVFNEARSKLGPVIRKNKYSAVHELFRDTTTSSKMWLGFHDRSQVLAIGFDFCRSQNLSNRVLAFLNSKPPIAVPSARLHLKIVCYQRLPLTVGKINTFLGKLTFSRGGAAVFALALQIALLGLQ
jgi:hypothetical protein